MEISILYWVPGDLGTFGVGGCGERARARSQGGRRPPGAPENSSGWGGWWGNEEFSAGFCPRVQDYARRRRGAARGTSRPGGLPAPGAPGRVSAGASREAASAPPGRAAALPPRRRRAVDCGLGAAAASGAVSPDLAGPSGSAGSGAAESREQTR